MDVEDGVCVAQDFSMSFCQSPQEALSIFKRYFRVAFKGPEELVVNVYVACSWHTDVFQPRVCEEVVEDAMADFFS